jgi:multidrug efflux pump subunit AcrA (membrane-fusion protein)
VRGDWRVIQSGLQEGEQVIVSPPEGLKDGDRVKTS